MKTSSKGSNYCFMFLETQNYNQSKAVNIFSFFTMSNGWQNEGNFQFFILNFKKMRKQAFFISEKVLLNRENRENCRFTVFNVHGGRIFHDSKFQTIIRNLSLFDLIVPLQRTRVTVFIDLDKWAPGYPLPGLSASIPTTRYPFFSVPG